MPTLAPLVLAAGHSQSAPSSGIGAALIVGAVLLVAILFGAIFWTMSRRSRASRGGVAHPPGDGRRGGPPFESIERRHFPQDDAERARVRPSERSRGRES